MRGRESSRPPLVVSSGKGLFPLTVVKVGGSLLSDEADLHRTAAAIVERRQQGESLLVVASALKGVTDVLEQATRQALESRNGDGWRQRVLERLRDRHEPIARALADNTALAQLQGSFDEVKRLLGSIRSSGELNESVYAQLLSLGERLSVPLLAAAIRARGHDSRPITSEEMGLRAKGSPRDGVCDLAGSAAGFQSLRPVLRQRVMVLTGFYGVDGNNGVTLFGRGGSDDTACAAAAGLKATHLELWKDVLGFMSADPRTVEAARVVAELSFDEVAKLGAYGSGIVHHGCLEPLRGRSTQVVICSIQGRHSTGTRLIEKRPKQLARVVAVAANHGWAELRLRGGTVGWNGVVGKLLGLLDEAQIEVKGFSTSKSGLCFTIQDAELERTKEALQPVIDGFPFEVQLHPSLVGAVGDGVAADPVISSRMLTCLSDSGIRGVLMAQPSGHAGLSCAVAREELKPALNGLHEHFINSLNGTE